MLHGEGIVSIKTPVTQRQVSLTRNACTRKTVHRTQIPVRLPARDDVVAAKRHLITEGASLKHCSLCEVVLYATLIERIRMTVTVAQRLQASVL